MVSYMETNTAEVDITANAEILVLDTSIPSGKGGRIKKIIVSYLASAPCNGFCELKLGSHAGPFRFPVGGVQVLATSGAAAYQDIHDVDIEVFANETVKGYLTLNAAATDAHIGIVWVA